MKKITILLVVLLLLVGLSGAFAAVSVYDPATVERYKAAGESFQGTSVRVLSMGGAGLGVRGYYDSWLMNPANAAKAGFKFSFPAVTVTAYNPVKILESQMFDKIEDDDPAGAAAEFLKTITQGYGDILTTDLSMGMSFGSFALSLEAQERLMSFQKTADSSSLNLIAQVTTAATVGYGFRINLAETMSIDLGVSAKAVYKAYLKAQSASTITSAVADENFDPAKTFMNETPLMAGYALPLSAGVNVNLPVGLTVSVVAKNFNGNYTMNTYDSMNDWAEEVLGQRLTEDADDDASTAAIEPEWTIEVPWRLDAGLTWAPNIGSLLRPIVAVDVVDVLAMSGKTGEDLTRAFFEQTRLGASVRLLSLFDFRYGLNKGYQSLGVGFDLLVFHIDAAYYTQEYGPSIGDKPIDALSLRFSLFSR
ncbi:hypothetical protein [Sphaerochaeta globosa]|uniref:DUF5723 domain-containing protein n=1 Tax=Sphaerochaeta globosa (strain ATCC BAA-1886 / DSM 22777 / Buddy) TaxID=158189 RepID=F0RYC5_SPHGB|nr:hypothetical protein [Sphaerochaeta globosa]ADY12696.1 hypothetical protein SpiBuddy_0869 [Sphaerochaeta globosa str. Buddy]